MNQKILTLYKEDYRIIQFLSRKLNIHEVIIKQKLYEFYSNNKNEEDKSVYDKLKKITNKTVKKYKPRYSRGDKRIFDIIKIYNDTPSTYLDFGGGDGEITSCIGKHFFLKKENIFCADIDYWGINKRNTNFNITYVDLPLTYSKLPFDDNYFSLITLFQCLHHIKNVNLIIKELYRICKNKGTIILREHNCESITTKYLIDLEHSIYDNFCSYPKDNEGNETYFCECKTKNEWRKLMIESGFSLIKSLDLNFNGNITCYYYDVFYKDSNKID